MPRRNNFDFGLSDELNAALEEDAKELSSIMYSDDDNDDDYDYDYDDDDEF